MYGILKCLAGSRQKQKIELDAAYYGCGEVKPKIGEQGAIADYRAVRCQQQGNREEYFDALKQIEKLEKESQGFWKRLFS